MKLECSVDGCKLPWARIEGGVLIIECRHHGERHINVVTLERLIEMMQKQAAGAGPR